MRLWLLIAACSLLTACAGGVLRPEPPPAPGELTDTPFFPQEKYQCGPAALATLLVDRGVQVTPEDLVEQVYLPGRRGSLQVEMKAAARRNGLVPWPVGGELASLRAALAAGHPVLVLQNLGWQIFPAWHYAVVIAAGPQRVVLRSGTLRRHVMDTESFLETWRRGGNWGFIALPPEKIPPGAVPEAWLRELTRVEQAGRADAALAGYRTMARRWPEMPAVTIGQASALASLGRPALAEVLLRKLLENQPEHPVALNNLALLLAGWGCLPESIELADRALRAAPPSLVPAIRATVGEVAQLQMQQCGG